MRELVRPAYCGVVDGWVWIRAGAANYYFFLWLIGTASCCVSWIWWVISVQDVMEFWIGLLFKCCNILEIMLLFYLWQKSFVSDRLYHCRKFSKLMKNVVYYKFCAIELVLLEKFVGFLERLKFFFCRKANQIKQFATNALFLCRTSKCVLRYFIWSSAERVVSLSPVLFVWNLLKLNFFKTILR